MPSSPLRKTLYHPTAVFTRAGERGIIFPEAFERWRVVGDAEVVVTE
jgi:hypothetical protein